MLQRIQLGALALGLACFVYLIHSIGLDSILRDLQLIGWGLLAIVCLELLIDAVNTIGWRFTFPPHERHVSLVSLFLVRLAGTAFNQALPSGTLGGEPLKAMLLQRHLPLSSAFASVITAKLAYGIAQGSFVFIGFIFAFSRLDLPAALSKGLVAALGLSLAGLGFFLWLQRRGLFATSARIAGILRLPESWVEKLVRATKSLDANIRDFHLLRRADLVLSVACHLVGFGIGAVQVYILLRFLGLPADVVTCVAIEAFSLLIQLALFLVPASIGVQEGGKVLIFTALGLPAAAGLSVGIAFRLTQIVCMLLGLSAFVFLQWWSRSAFPEEPSPLASGQAFAIRGSQDTSE